MPLNKLIDLIAEVAVKRTTQKREREPETPGTVQRNILKNLLLPRHWFNFDGNTS